MKLVIIMFFTSIAFAKSSIYDLKSDGKQIGILTVKTENLENRQYKYKTHLKLSSTYR